MVFSSLTFIYFFLPLTLIIYYLSNKGTYRNIILTISSLLFYAWGEPVWIILLVFSATIDYIHGKIIEYYKGKWQSKGAVISSLCLNLGLLIIFKYSSFIFSSINSVFKLSIQVKENTLPIGISFYTFQTISYVLDVYRGDVTAQKSYGKFLLFVSLFHQLVAGPIVRYHDIAKEIEHRTFQSKIFSNGIERFVIGLFKKVFFANTAGRLALPFLTGSSVDPSIIGLWYGIFLFGIQIYFDFSGYSDMAIGLGHMFGFTYKENFNFPYFSRSVREFWRRWHISLGSFFKDYLYIPLGGNRRFFIRNMLIVWTLTGLWHGASWNFVLWGLMYGILIILENFLSNKINVRLPKILGHIYIFIVTCTGWTIFYFEDTKTMISYLSKMYGRGDIKLFGIDVQSSIINNLIFIIISICTSLPIIPYIKAKIINSNFRRSSIYQVSSILKRPILSIFLLILSTVLLVGQSYNPFLYYRF